MTKRKSLSKKTRFDIFHRDAFMCQYCGSQPPEATLVVDHILPVSKDGNNDESNLITSCESCNQGKGAKVLTNPSPRPDADIQWLEMQQELAELRRYQLLKTERDKLLEVITYDLTIIFEDVSKFNYKTAWVVEEIRNMLRHYSPELVEEAITISARKVAGGYLDRYEWSKYTYGILRNMVNER